jgi:hypothetical protein
MHDSDFIRALIAIDTIAPTTDWLTPTAACAHSPPTELQTSAGPVAAEGCEHRCYDADDGLG